MNSAIPALTSIRFFFALQVLLLHFSMANLTSLPALPWPVTNMIMAGYIGVNFFFVLSGFILAVRYFGPGAGPLDVQRFFWARFARVYPIYLFSMLAMVPFVLLFTFPPDVVPKPWPLSILSVVSLVTLMQSWIPAFAGNWNSPAWSLSAEAFFYVTFPFVAAGLWSKSAPMLFSALLIFYSVSMACAVVPVVFDIENLGGVMGHEIQRAHVGHGWTFFFRLNPALLLPEFLMGVAAGFIYLKHPDQIKKYSPAFILIGLVGILAVISCSSIIPMMLLHNGMLTPLLILLIWGLTDDRRQSFLKWPALVTLGKASYALYLMHIPVYYALSLFGLQDWPFGIHFTLYVSICVAVSLLCYFKIEIPWQRALLQRYKIKPS